MLPWSLGAAFYVHVRVYRTFGRHFRWMALLDVRSSTHCSWKYYYFFLIYLYCSNSFRCQPWLRPCYWHAAWRQQQETAPDLQITQEKRKHPGWHFTGGEWRWNQIMFPISQGKPQQNEQKENPRSPEHPSKRLTRRGPQKPHLMQKQESQTDLSYGDACPTKTPRSQQEQLRAASSCLCKARLR